MQNQFGIDVTVPSPASRQLVRDVIYQELCHGVIRQDSRERYQEIIRELVDKGAESIILGYTEIELLISQTDSRLPVHPSTTIHAHAAVDFALREETQAMSSE